MHPNEIDLTKLSESELAMLRRDIPSGWSDRHLAAFEEQLARQRMAKFE